VLYVTVFKYFLCFQCNDTALKITTNFSDDVNFLHAFHLQFTINANIVYIPVEATFSISIVCANHHGKYFKQLVYRCVYCVLNLQRFSRTHFK